VLSDSPAAYWRLDESSGTTAADASGSGNAGAYQYAPTLGAPTLVSGGTSSVAFDGGSQRVLVPDSPSLSPTASLSLEAWVSANSLPAAGSYRTVAIKGASYWLRVNGTTSGARAQFYIRQGDAWRGTTADLSLAPGVAYHLVGTYDGSTLRLYVNGTQRGALAYTGAADDTTSPLQIASSGGSTWDGRVDEVAVYGQALAATAVATHHQAGAQ
jgi:hypothetical protein